MSNRDFSKEKKHETEDRQERPLGMSLRPLKNPHCGLKIMCCES